MRKFFYLCVIFTALFSFGCGGSTTETVNQPQNTNRAIVVGDVNAVNKPEPQKNPQTPFEKALFNVRVGDFEQVLVFRRKDGGKFTEEDKEFLRQNSPNAPDKNVNRWAACDDGTCFVAGTNNEFTRENLIALQNRFDAKDYSKGDQPAEVTLPQAEEKKN